MRRPSDCEHTGKEEDSTGKGSYSFFVHSGLCNSKHIGWLQYSSGKCSADPLYWMTYAATKGFVLAFGEGLAYELRNSGVRVVTVCPGFTKTGLYADSGVPGMAGRLLPFATPEAVVRVALAAYDAGRVVRVVGLTNRLLAVSGALTPRFILRGLMARMFAPSTAGPSSSRPPKQRPEIS